MMLLTKALRAKLPPLYATEDQPPDEKKAIVKFFTPDSNWTWYGFEFDGEDTFFGLVVGFETELGYFSLSELAGVRGKWGLPIERDRWFKPTALLDLPECPQWVKDQHHRQHLEEWEPAPEPSVICLPPPTRTAETIAA